jgi:hypothetical protein
VQSKAPPALLFWRGREQESAGALSAGSQRSTNAQSVQLPSPKWKRPPVPVKPPPPEAYDGQGAVPVAALAASKPKAQPLVAQRPVSPDRPPPRQLMAKAKAPPPQAAQGQGAEHLAALPMARPAAPSRYPRPRSPENPPRQPQGKAKAPPPKAAQRQGAEHLAALASDGAPSGVIGRVLVQPVRSEEVADQPARELRSPGAADEAERGPGRLPWPYGDGPRWTGQPEYNVWGKRGTFVMPGWRGESEYWVKKGHARYPYWPFGDESSGPQQQQHHPQQHPRQQHPSPPPPSHPPPTASDSSSPPPPPPPVPDPWQWNGSAWTMDGAPPPPASAPAPPPSAWHGSVGVAVAQKARDQNDSLHMAQGHDGHWRLPLQPKERMADDAQGGLIERNLMQPVRSADAPEDKSSGQWASSNAESLNRRAHDAQERRSGDGGATSWLDGRDPVVVGSRFSNSVMMILGRPVVVPGYFSLFVLTLAFWFQV